MKLYRVLIDENGQSDCSDYASRDIAESEFKKAKARKSVFSVSVQELDDDARTFGPTIWSFERWDGTAAHARVLNAKS
jgi:hypothetical protein